MSGDSGSSFGAILLAGGRASRVGGAVKPLFDVGGMTLLDRAVEAVAPLSERIVVVGPRMEVRHPASATIEWVREDPPFGGPAAAIVAALAAWPNAPAWMLVLACDLPRVGDAVRQLTHDLALQPADIDGLCLADAAARPQWLTGVYRTQALRRGADRLDRSGADASVRGLLSDLAIAVTAAPADDSGGHIALDIDTWEDLEDARRRFAAFDAKEPT